MDRPKNQQTNHLLEIVEAIRRSEAHLADLKEQGQAAARALADIPDKRERIVSGAYVYWFAPEINANIIAEAASGKSHPATLLRSAEDILGISISAGIPCDRCHTDMPITSRTQMKQLLDNARHQRSRYAEGYNVLCASCEAHIYRMRQQRYREESTEDKRISKIMKNIPYEEYLTTDYFSRQRANYLSVMGVIGQESLSCEVCGSEERRGVYHMNLDELGVHDSLMLLCQPCSKALAGAGKICGIPGQGNLLTDNHMRHVQCP